MALFIGLYLYCLIFSVLEVNDVKISFNRVNLNYKKWAFIIFWIFILILGLCRNEQYGFDWYGYKYDFFLKYSRMTFGEVITSKTDIGYALLNWTISRFTDQFVICRNIIYAITNISMGLWIYKKSKMSSLSALIYLSFSFLAFDFFIMRQALAISIIIWGYDFILEKKLIKYIFIVFLAATFHSTAVVALIFYPLVNSKIKTMGFIKHSLIILGTAILSPLCIRFLVQRYIYGRYMDDIVSGEGINKLVLLLVFIGIITFFNNSEEFIDNTNNGLFEIVLAMIYFQTVALTFSLFSRMTIYSTVFLIIFIPLCLSKIKNKENRKSFYFAIIILLIILYIFEVYNGLTSNKYIPYISLWNKK